ncbi:HAD-IA family hydrolase [Candidatus Woesearchaeota archaeon]|nr:HAD-IA family hydrolase [Candidatus Woesearchaeota archaeon]
MQKKRKKELGLICFDLDNTLIKSNKCHLEAYQLAFKKNKIKKKITNKEILKHFGEGSRKIIQNLFPGTTAKFIDKIIYDHDLLVRKNTKKFVKVIPGAKRILKKLQQQWKLALISNCNHELIMALLEAAKIPKKWFSIIIGQDQVKHPKPAPDELLKAEHIARHKAAYFIGDSIYDIRAGKRAHVRVIAIPSGVNNIAQLKKESPYRICKKLKEISTSIQ